MHINEKIISKLFGESRNYGFWSMNGAGVVLEYRAVREDHPYKGLQVLSLAGAYNVSAYQERKISRGQTPRGYRPTLNSLEYTYEIWRSIKLF